MICSKCGKDIPDEASFCPYCMTKFVKMENSGENNTQDEIVENEAGTISPSNYKKEYIILYAIAVIMLVALLIISVCKNNGCIGNVGSDNKKSEEKESEEKENVESDKALTKMGRILKTYNGFLEEYLMNDDEDSYKTVMDTFLLDEELFVQWEGNEDVYSAVYVQDGETLFCVDLYFLDINGESELVGVRVKTYINENTNKAAYERLRILSYGFMAVADSDKTVEEIKEIFKTTTMTPGNELIYDGVSYKAKESKESFTFDIGMYADEESNKEEQGEGDDKTIEESLSIAETVSPMLPEETTQKSSETEKQTEGVVKNEEETSKNIKEEEDDIINSISLSGFNDFDNLVKQDTTNEYTVKFDNETFVLTSVTGKSYNTFYDDDLIWSEDNVVVRTRMGEVDSNPGCLVRVIAYKEYYEGNYSVHSSNENYYLNLTFACTSNPNYSFDVENTTEMYNFIMKVADKVLKYQPVDKGVALSTISDFSAIINREVYVSNKYRVNFDNETFCINTATTELSYAYIESSKVVWYRDDIVITQTKSKTSSNLYSSFITVYKLNEKYSDSKLQYEGGGYIFAVDINVDCMSKVGYAVDMETSTELYNFIMKIVDSL